MTEDDRLDAAIRKLAEAYQRPPEPPRDALWGRIQAQRAEWTAPRGRREFQVRPWIRWAAGLAAALVIGVAIGRFSVGGPGNVGTVAATDAHAGALLATTDQSAQAAYRIAATEYLNRVETLLSVFTIEAGRGQVANREFEGPARRLLLRNRLLQDSPAADDAALAALLEDIEVVLVQIAAYAGDGDEEELGFIAQGIQDRSVMLKLRAALPSGTVPVAMQGAL
jgi:hypothetical protein